MQTKLRSLFILMALLAGFNQATAQGARFFRISGLATTRIIAFQSNGTLVWSSVLAGTNYAIQTQSSLIGGTNWVSYVQLPAASTVNTNQLVAFNPPVGMTFIPAGMFTMGNLIINGTTITKDFNITDADPTNVTVSACYLDINLVSANQ
jgi:hypothetical protein